MLAKYTLSLAAAITVVICFCLPPGPANPPPEYDKIAALSPPPSFTPGLVAPKPKANPFPPVNRAPRYDPTVSNDFLFVENVKLWPGAHYIAYDLLNRHTNNSVFGFQISDFDGVEFGDIKYVEEYIYEPEQVFEPVPCEPADILGDLEFDRLYTREDFTEHYKKNDLAKEYIQAFEHSIGNGEHFFVIANSWDLNVRKKDITLIEVKFVHVPDYYLEYEIGDWDFGEGVNLYFVIADDNSMLTQIVWRFEKRNYSHHTRPLVNESRTGLWLEVTDPYDDVLRTYLNLLNGKRELLVQGYESNTYWFSGYSALFQTAYTESDFIYQISNIVGLDRPDDINSVLVISDHFSVEVEVWDYRFVNLEYTLEYKIEGNEMKLMKNEKRASEKDRFL